MRELKFRFVNKIKDTGKINFIYTSLDDIEMEDSWQGKVNYIRLCTEQYTGLKDKNGVEIYKGDIVKKGESFAEIKYCNETGSFIAKGKTHSFYFGWDINSTELEVIGNIHENTELL